MEKLSEKRYRNQVRVPLNALESILQKVLEHDWSHTEQEDAQLWKPDAGTNIKPGFWPALLNKLFVASPKKRERTGAS